MTIEQETWASVAGWCAKSVEPRKHRFGDPRRARRARMLKLWALFVQRAGSDIVARGRQGMTQFPHVTDDGRWTTLPIDRMSETLSDGYEHGNWTAGFWAGSAWLCAVGGDDNRFRSSARFALDAIAPRALDKTTHDLGFLFYPSFVLGGRLGFLGPTELGPAWQAAQTLADRYETATGLLRAFGPMGPTKWAGVSAIDTMMNVPLLWWAAQEHRSPRMAQVALRHVKTSARHFLREDGSSFHLVQCDPHTGRFVGGETLQGKDRESCWSRGQAWAACGMSWSYAITSDPDLLTAAERAIAYYFAHLPTSGLPPWDFASTSPAPTDASASAVVALGLLILSARHPAPRAREVYEQAATHLLLTIGTEATPPDDRQAGVLHQSSYFVPSGNGVECATAWGDFFFGLAIACALRVVDLSAIMGDPLNPEIFQQP